MAFHKTSKCGGFLCNARLELELKFKLENSSFYKIKLFDHTTPYPIALWHNWKIINLFLVYVVVRQAEVHYK